MSNPYERTTLGFSDLSLEPFGDIPTEPDAFLRWAAKLDRHQPFKYELSEGKVSRMMTEHGSSCRRNKSPPVVAPQQCARKGYPTREKVKGHLFWRCPACK